MITPQEKAQYVSWFIATKYDIPTQRNYTTKYAKQAPARQSIRNCHKQFMETGTLLHKPRCGRPRTSEEDIKRIHQSFSHSPIAWPPRSLDITPLDFFLWGYVKDVMYHTKVKDISDLKKRITAAVEAIDEEMLKRTWTEIEYRLDILHATNGAHIEIY